MHYISFESINEEYVVISDYFSKFRVFTFRGNLTINKRFQIV